MKIGCNLQPRVHLNRGIKVLLLKFLQETRNRSDHPVFAFLQRLEKLRGAVKLKIAILDVKSLYMHMAG